MPYMYYFPLSLSPFAPCSVARTRTRARLQNHNSVYISDDKPSRDNVIALIIRRGCGGGYHLLITSPQHPSDAHPATSHRTVIRIANTTQRQPFYLLNTLHPNPPVLLQGHSPRPLNAIIAGHIPMGIRENRAERLSIGAGH